MEHLSAIMKAEVGIFFCGIQECNCLLCGPTCQVGAHERQRTRLYPVHTQSGALEGISHAVDDLITYIVCCYLSRGAMYISRQPYKIVSAAADGQRHDLLQLTAHQCTPLTWRGFWKA